MFNDSILKDGKKIHVSATWCWSDIRNICIRENYYTRGSNAEYNALCNYVLRHNPTTKAIYHAAADIVDHSDLSHYGAGRDDLIAGVMFEITRDAVHVFYDFV